MSISISWAKKHSIAVIQEDPDASTIVVAMQNIYDELLLEKIKIITGMKVLPEERTLAEIRKLWSAETDFSSDLSSEKFKSDGSSWESEPIINLVDTILLDALERNASDIHLEPRGDSFCVRFRIDGMLTLYRELPSWLSEPTLIRLKILAQMDITERRIPLDGSFSFEGKGSPINIRVSTLPVAGGEKCVLRLLQSTDSNITLDDLELSVKSRDYLREIFQKPQGLILITGPTGSGKTTTLYAGLREIIHKKINVTTIENPVEYVLSGANQVQTNEKCGLTFATALKSILRQDPDVILVGEIRDRETANIALQAAQTGHLVLSTLHTNSAAGAISRLMDLGLQESCIQEVLLGTIAQRLLRKLTPDGLSYKGRIAAMEILKPDGNYVEGTLSLYAERLMDNRITDSAEVLRVLGNSI